jgi:hypothetical protein
MGIPIPIPIEPQHKKDKSIPDSFSAAVESVPKTPRRTKNFRFLSNSVPITRKRSSILCNLLVPVKECKEKNEEILKQTHLHGKLQQKGKYELVFNQKTNVSRNI